MGDCIMTAWAAAGIRALHPSAEIHWAIQPRCAAVVAGDLARPRIVPREKRQSSGGLMPMLRFFLDLRRTRFDVGFDFQGYAKTALCLRFAGPRERFALAGLRIRDRFAESLTPPTQVGPENRHVIEREIVLVRTWRDIPFVARPPMPAFPEESKAWEAGEAPITLQTGAGGPHKTWPREDWQKVADALTKTGRRVVALGGPGDPDLDRVQSLVGRASLEESLAAVRASRLHIAADTGTGHAAAAYGVPLISLFGATDPERYRPWGDGVRL
ncbi:MAG: glycosyltransferase family 9 protein [Fimbriimonadaceae bacterium]|nr:glycosyltransferase family 9 protein [Fimbriimonadaceae bacterium]